jgi:pyruvate-ferredoxin/flavodoxin oxidoreductase
MCNQCAYVCPHACIRPVLATDEQLASAPEAFVVKDAKIKGTEYKFRMQVSPLDCTGCGNCADVCPAKTKALVMEPLAESLKTEEENWNFGVEVPIAEDVASAKNVKSSQFLQPLFEFSGACAGCGETPYVKLVTQLFGDRMIVANATGCSSIYGGSAPTCPYTKNAKGQGPAWANSLFEDNAEFGYGMNLAVVTRRNNLKIVVKSVLEMDLTEGLKALLGEWLEKAADAEATTPAPESLSETLEEPVVNTETESLENAEETLIDVPVVGTQETGTETEESGIKPFGE